MTGRVVEVAPERLGRWLAGFAANHGAVIVTPGPEVVRLAAADGAGASCAVPFPPLSGDLVGHCAKHRRFGLVLLRRGGYAVGLVEGTALVGSKVGTRYIQSRTAAGGWSQQRYARRRANQADELVEAVAEHALRVLGDPKALEAVVGGGDRLLLDLVRAHPRLRSLEASWVSRRLVVPDPRREVLEKAVVSARAVRISLDQ